MFQNKTHVTITSAAEIPLVFRMLAWLYVTVTPVLREKHAQVNIRRIPIKDLH